MKKIDKTLTIVLAQINPTVGDIAGNLKRAQHVLGNVPAQTDLVVFPELFVCGYPPEDLLTLPNFIAHSQKAVRELTELSKKIAIIVGLPRCDAGKLRNSAAMLHQGRVAGFADKILLPTYDVFDELRYSGM